MYGRKMYLEHAPDGGVDDSTALTAPLFHSERRSSASRNFMRTCTPGAQAPISASSTSCLGTTNSPAPWRG